VGAFEPESQQKKLASLLAEWNRICAAQRVDVERWEKRLGELAEEERHLRREGAWVDGPDHYLGVLGHERVEVTHSRLIAWLLDPCKHHGLGTRFLEGLLAEAFGATVARELAPGLPDARPRCEVPVLNGRLDIVVEAPGLYLVIENKVDAPEGDGQCEYYFTHVKMPGRRFILLSPDGRRATSKLPSVVDAFVPLQYRTLRRILNSALTNASSGTRTSGARGRHVAEDYVRTLEREFR
jgi:hypothetical protein